MPVKWSCAGCGLAELRPPSKALKERCAPCHYKTRVGEGNPNFRALDWRICKTCGKTFHSYKKGRKYCSIKCYNATRPPKPTACPKPYVPPKPTRCPRPVRQSALQDRTCMQCGRPFSSYPSSAKKYCSYQCHLDSGGAHRAGKASAGAILLKYGAKKDANHGDIVNALKAIGVYVIDTSSMGCGFPDLILGFRMKTLLMEIKNPKTSYGRKGLNKNQREWKENWIGGPYCVVDSKEAAIRAVQSL